MRHTTEIALRFADIDAMGHVNNAVYLNYFEQARMAFFEQAVGGEWDWKNDGIVLARNEIDYRIPIRLGDKVEIETSLEEIGNKSMTLAYQVHTKENAKHVFATGKSVIVCFDYSRGVTCPVPDAWRLAFGIK